MKKIYVLWSLAIATLMANVFVACNNDETLDDIYTPNGFTMQLAKAPDFVFYSNGNVLASTFLTTRAETRGEGDIVEPEEGKDFFVVERYDYRDPINGIVHNTGYKPVPDAYAPYAANAPVKSTDGESGVEGVSKAEYDFVMDYIEKHSAEGKTECTIKKDYFVQNVGTSYKLYTFQIPNWSGYREEIDRGGGKTMNNLYFNNFHMYYYKKWDETKYGYTAKQGHRLLCLYDKIPLTNPSYREEYGPQDNMKYNAYTFYYIEYEGKMCCYLCFDYRMTKPDDNGGTYVYNGDGVYDDWVIKITPADGSDIVVPDDDNENEEGGNEGGENTTPVVTDEVEVNFSVNDEMKKDDYIATKLSIHVRANTDVEVFIPVTQQYYCDVDDMAIVYSHKKDLNYQYSNPGESSLENVKGYTYTHTIADKEILVTVKYEAEGIRVTTLGVTQEVLDYLQQKYQDGITFEVWNYFNSAIPDPENDKETLPVTRAELKTEFDKSIVSFTSTEHPTQYVNAFAMLYDYKKEDLHVYMKEDKKPYMLEVTYDAAGKFVSETKTDNLLDQKYWVTNEDGTFKEFVGSKNKWDCTVTPPAAYVVEATHNGQNPADFNVVYKK